MDRRIDGWMDGWMNGWPGRTAWTAAGRADECPCAIDCKEGGSRDRQEKSASKVMQTNDNVITYRAIENGHRGCPSVARVEEETTRGCSREGRGGRLGS